MKEQVVPFNHSSLSKREQVGMMFDHIAFRYDLMNHLLSFGIDRQWRRKIRKVLAPSRPQILLDVATGTGDVAIELAQLHPEQIIALDISSEMMELGIKKVKDRKLDSIISFQKGQAENLPFEHNKFDAVTVAFGVRNFENLPKSFLEIYRVLKPGGRIIVLEFSHPKQFPFRQLYRLYFKWVCPLLGKWITGNRMAYEYLYRSVNAFPEGKDFSDQLVKAGFQQLNFQPLTWGVSTIYSGIK